MVISFLYYYDGSAQGKGAREINGCGWRWSDRDSSHISIVNLGGKKNAKKEIENEFASYPCYLRFGTVFDSVRREVGH